VAEEVDGEALATLLVNLKRKTLKCIAIRLTGYEQRSFLQDLAILTGATTIDPAVGIRLENVRNEHLGSAERVIVDLMRTEIVGGRGDPASLATYIADLQNDRRDASDFRKEALAKRIARLDGMIVKIRIGAETPQDLSDKMYRTESALRAAHEAIHGGCVTGGARSLLFAASKITELHSERPGEQEGIRIAISALTSPFRALVSAAGEDPTPIMHELLSNPDSNIGYDVQAREVRNLVESGVLDSLPVVQRAVEVSLSVARRFLETGSWEVAGGTD
jgi:chaperonin GroEL